MRKIVLNKKFFVEAACLVSLGGASLPRSSNWFWLLKVPVFAYVNDAYRTLERKLVVLVATVEKMDELKSPIALVNVLHTAMKAPHEGFMFYGDTSAPGSANPHTDLQVLHPMQELIVERDFKFLKLIF